MDTLENPRINYMDPRLSSYNPGNYPQTGCINAPPMLEEEKDRQIIDSWLSQKGKFIGHYIATPPPQRGLLISSARNSLKSCLDILEKLEQTETELRDNVESMSSAEWKQKSLDIGTLKDALDKHLAPFEDNTTLVSLKSAVNLRNKKRRNQKQRKKQHQEWLKAQKEKQQEAHKKIDQWLEGKKDETERVKMEEKMKKDADCVLYEVTKKKSEARKHISLISALVKLRTVRDNMATQRGEKPSLEDRKAFGAVTEKLIRMWENSSQTYCKEEQCLQVMLQHNATKDTNMAEQAKKSQVISKWQELIFGKKDLRETPNATFWALTSADRDLETFIAIRKSWDTFLANPNNTGASSIPTSWVLPPQTPNASWDKYLYTD